MPDTLTLIQKITVGETGASSVTFSNIPQTYTDLKIVACVRSNRTGAINSFMRLYPNGDSTGITYRALFGTGTSVSSFIESAAGQYVGEINATNSTSNTFSSTEIYIPNYTSGAQKSYSVDFVTENNASLAYTGLLAALWANTNAITGIQLLDGLANFVQHSTFYLYGVTKFGSSTPGSAAAYATGGDIITTDGTYWYHIFRSSGTFTPRKLITCDALVVAGGGGTSTGPSGGAGAGQVRLHSSQSLTTTTYTVPVGAGGAGGAASTSSYHQGNDGNDSQFGSTTAATKGSKTTNENGGNSGSGNTGGAFAAGTYYTTGGGAGQGANGANGNANSGQAGAGGAGINTYSSWHSATNTGVSGYIAGGGGGGAAGWDNSAYQTSTLGAGGLGGGGTGGISGQTNENNMPGGNGVPNTGSGGGGGGYWFQSGVANRRGKGGNGGSGMVIVRYPV